MDPNFTQSVVLLIQHDDNGAMGVIVNRPIQVTVKQACEPLGGVDCKVDAPLHIGGPCEGPLIALHTLGEAGETEVIPGVFVSVQRDNVQTLLEQNITPAKFVANYAGWGAGQLEAEIDEGSWLIVDARSEDIFSLSSEKLWSRLIAHATLGRWIDPSKIPEDPSLN